MLLQVTLTAGERSEVHRLMLNPDHAVTAVYNEIAVPQAARCKIIVVLSQTQVVVIFDLGGGHTETVEGLHASAEEPLRARLDLADEVARLTSYDEVTIIEERPIQDLMDKAERSIRDTIGKMTRFLPP